MNNNYPHPAMENEGLQPYVATLEAEQELRAYELENSRPAVESLPATPNHNLNHLSPDFVSVFLIIKKHRYNENYITGKNALSRPFALDCVI